MTQKGVVHVVLIVLLAIIGIVVFLWFRKFTSLDSSQVASTPDDVSNLGKSDDIGNWKTFTSEVGGFTFKYPNNWEVKKYEENIEIPPCPKLPIILSDLGNNTGNGGLSLEATNLHSCLSELRAPDSGWNYFSKAVWKKDYFIPRKSIYINGIEVQQSMSIVPPGVPTIDSLFTGIKDKPVDTLYFNHSYNLHGTIKNFDEEYDTSCEEVKEEPLLGYYCTNGEVLHKEEVLDAIELNNKILFTFEFTD